MAPRMWLGEFGDVLTLSIEEVLNKVEVQLLWSFIGL
jgi:hypothetical protein